MEIQDNTEGWEYFKNIQEEPNVLSTTEKHFESFLDLKK